MNERLIVIKTTLSYKVQAADVGAEGGHTHTEKHSRPEISFLNGFKIVEGQLSGSLIGRADSSQ